MLTTIKDIKLAKLNNAEYTQFLTLVNKLIEVATPTQLGLDKALVKSFQDNIVKLTDIALQVRASKETESLQELDKNRDKLLVYLLSYISNERKSPVPERETAAKELYITTKAYAGTQNLPYRQETQTIQGLIADLGKDDLNDHIITLGLEKAVQDLAQANSQYQTISLNRADNQASNPVEGVKKYRQSADAQYKEIALRAFAQSVALPVEENANFVKALNKLIEDTDAAYKLRKSQKPVTDSKNPNLPGENA